LHLGSSALRVHRPRWVQEYGQVQNSVKSEGLLRHVQVLQRCRINLPSSCWSSASDFILHSPGNGNMIFCRIFQIIGSIGCSTLNGPTRRSNGSTMNILLPLGQDFDSGPSSIPRPSFGSLSHYDLVWE
ncbi:hypothetical protein DVH24_014093, partial [Malus domestica]